MVGSSLELQSFQDFRMSIFWDYLNMVGILFSMKHLFSNASGHLLALGPILFSCSTKTSSLPAAFLSFFSNSITFLYSSLLKGYTMEVCPSVAGGSTGGFGADGMLPLPLLGVGVNLVCTD